jgi:hypothetical protein
MKKIFDIRHIIIVVLLIISLLEFINPKGFMPHRTQYVSQIDSIPYAVHDTIPVEVETQIEIPVEVPVRVEVPVPTPIAVDTNEILKIYFKSSVFTNKLTLPNNVGTITITDSISQNKIMDRKFISNVKKMIVNDTIYTPRPKENEVYFGVDAKLDKPNVINLIGIGFLFKNKDDKHMYKLGVGVSNRIDANGTTGELVPYIGGGAYWKLGKKRQ